MNTIKRRGGRREGSGRKKSRPTSVIRIPDAYKQQVMELVKFLDDDSKKFGGAHELPLMTDSRTGRRMILSYVLDEYHPLRVPLGEIFKS